MSGAFFDKIKTVLTEVLTSETKTYKKLRRSLKIRPATRTKFKRSRRYAKVPALVAAAIVSVAAVIMLNHEGNAQSSLPQWQCEPTAYLFQYTSGTSTQVYAVDLVTGSDQHVLTIPNERINAVGYNALDNYVYGWKLQSSTDGGLIRIGSDGNWERVDVPGFTGAGGITGTVDENGQYWITGNARNDIPWAQIDLDSGTLVASGTMTGLSGYSAGADWVHVPGGGDFIYRVATRDGQGWLVAFNRTTKQNNVLGSLGSMATIGASYADANGYLYAQENSSGNIYRIDIDTLTVSQFSSGPISSNNDGAMCSEAQIYTDYGDAPSSYGTLVEQNGPRHVVRRYNPATNTAPVMLGASVDAEDDGIVSAAADGDDNNNIDDEDAISDPIAIYAGSPTDVNVAATNNSDNDVTLAGWIDLNGNGTFEAGERATTTVPANSGTQTYILSFPASNLVDDSFARFRIFGGTVADPQPTGSADNGEVEDHRVLAARVVYEKTISPDGTTELAPGETFTYTITARNAGSLPITGLSLTDNLASVLDDATYNNDVTADIGSATFDSPDQITWNGDLDVGETATIQYTVTVNNPISGDGVLKNDIVGIGPGSNCTDNPAVYPECITRAPQPDINAAKEVVSISPGPNARPNSTINYRFTINNAGEAAATGITVVDDLAGALDDAIYNADASATSGTIAYNPATQRLIWSGSLAANGEAGDTATVEYSLTVRGASDLDDGTLQNALLLPGCPNPAIFDQDDPNFNPDCVTITAVDAWTTTKTVSPSGNVAPNDTIAYTIIATNTGGSDLAGLTFTDNLSGVVDDATYNNDAQADFGSVSFSSNNLTWNGDLAQGESATITYTVTVHDALSLGDGILSNAVTGGDNCPGSDCSTTTDVAAYAVSKQSSAPSYVVAGDTITYTITVQNTGSVDFTAANPARFADDLSDVLDDATYNNDANASIGEVDLTEPLMQWNGALASTETATITYSVTLNEASLEGNGLVRNAFSGGDNCPEDPPIDPSDPDFNPDCVSINPVLEWVALKTSEPSGAVKPGDTVSYTIRIINSGGVDLNGSLAPSVVDDLTNVLDDAKYNHDATASLGSTSYLEPELTWSGDLEVGEEAEITYSATVNTDEFGDAILVNSVTGAPNCPSPAITDPADAGYNPDCAPINHIAAFEVDKASNPPKGSTVRPDDTITYTIAINNTGAVNFTDFELEDDLSNVLDDATFDPGSLSVSANAAGTATLVGDKIVFDGDVPTGETVRVTYSVTVNPIEEIGDGKIRNVVFAPHANCSDTAHESCNTTHQVSTEQNGGLAGTGQNLFAAAIAATLMIGLAIIALHQLRKHART